MAAQKRILKNKKKTTQPIVFKSDNLEPPLAKEYEAAWKLKYEKLSDVEKRMIDNAKTDSIHGVYDRHFFVDAFVKRVIDLVDAEPTNETEE